MCKTIRKFIAYILSIALVLSCVPIIANSSQSEELTTQIEEKVNESDLSTTIVDEIIEKREKNVKHFRMSDGSYTAAVYPYDVHYESENGELVDIDNSLVAENDGADDVLSNKSNDTFVKFMKKSNPNKLYTINKGEHKIKVSIASVSKVSAVLDDADYSQDDFELKNLGSKVTYNNILENTDIEFTLISNQLKENIIIKDKVDFNSLTYTYHLNGSLEAVQEDDKNIALYDKDGNFVFSVSAPVMWDANGNYNDNLSLEILEEKNSNITVKLCWETDENVKYPLTVDPVMSFEIDRNNIQDTHIIASNPTTNYDVNNHIRVRNDGYAMVYFPTPLLSSGDKIVNAKLVLIPYAVYDPQEKYSNVNSYNPPLYITAHRILRTWEETTATYQNVAPDSNFYDNTVEAMRVVDGDSEPYSWDITRLVNEWVEGYNDNHGILLKYAAPPSDGSMFDAFFCSTNGKYIPAAARPQILYQYVNTTGVEDYFSYHTQNLGYAGTAYTNDLTGNLTVVNNVLNVGGSLAPISVSLSYNLNNVDKSQTPYGTGWKLNWAQKIDWSVKSNYTNEQYAKYTDADGTEHFFEQDESTGIWSDEINPDRKVYFIEATGDYKMTDSSGTCMYFTRNGTLNEWYLYKVVDVYGNYIQMILNSSNLNRVDKVYSSTGDVVDFVYNEYGFLTGIKYYDEGTTKTITVDYNNHIVTDVNNNVPVPNNCISDIFYPDGTSVQYYYYNETKCLAITDDVGGESIVYDYTEGDIKRVNYVAEYSSDGVLGASMSIAYNATSTTFTDITNNRKYLYTFAKNGTLKSAVDVTNNDGNGYGQYYEYNEGDTEKTKGTGNLTSISKSQKSTVNILSNHSFETDGQQHNFTAWNETTAAATGGCTTQEKYIGWRSYKITRPATSDCSRAIGFYYIYLEANKTYTLSAYVNTKDMVSGTGGASLMFIDTEAIYESEFITEAANKWQRLSLTFTAKRSEYVSLCMNLSGATGSVYFDCIQLEEGDLSDYNLLENAGFEQVTSGVPDNWGLTSGYSYLGSAEKVAGNYSGVIFGGPNVSADILQIIQVPNGKNGDVYVASAFAKAKSVEANGWQFTLLVRFTKNGATVNEQNLLFNSYTTDWQKISDAAKATGDYDAIQFWLLYYHNANTVFFDNAQLIKDTFGNTYTYDENGNLLSTVDLQGKSEYTFQYNGDNQLIEQTNLSGSKITYNYNTTIKQQLDSVSAGGVTTAYTYDAHGNALTAETFDEDSGITDKITSSATYSTDGDYMLSSTDSRGNTTNYTYNEDRGYIKSITDANNVTTNYSYYANELLQSVSSGNSTVTYNYDSAKRLSSILSPSGTTYNFVYNSFGRNTEVKINTRTIVTNVYDNARGLLDYTTYGNGTVVDYSYDALNRQTDTIINQILRYKNVYDGSSRLLERRDILSGKKIKYEYDILDRAVSEKLIDSSNNVYAKLSVRYDDTKNRVSGYNVDIEGVYKVTDFVYGENNMAPDILTTVEHNGAEMLMYNYDGLNRRISQTLVGAGFFETEYTYVDGRTKGSTTDNPALTTTLIKTIKNGDDTLEYAYDNLGNITSIKENGTVVESYTYDSLNQLKTVTRGSDVWEYTYDNGGNILSVKKNGVVEKSYTYGDTEWKDLLTNYNGTNITYDAIGNPLSYRGGMSFTWSDGRKLTAIAKGSDSISYTYNANGLRNSKTVNGTATQYYWLNGILQGQKKGSEYIIFLHDENGTAYGFMLKNGTTREEYYYIFNAQGDVIGILDSHGTQVVKYTYNAWGELLSTTGTKANTIGQKNPIRYRGYYYDTETGFYYLQSRYYDPITQRFVNADGAISGVGGSIQGYNMFSYCFNNPVNMQDETGNWPSWNDIKTGFKKAVDWTKKNIVEPIRNFVGDIVEDFNSYNPNNQSEDVVFESNYFSNYKGALVVKAPFYSSFSFGLIGLSTEQQDSNSLKHEYGHTLQMKKMGLGGYITDVAIPSVTINILDRQGKLPYNYYSYPWEAEANKLGGSTLSDRSKPSLPQGGYNSYWDLIQLFFE